MSVSGVETTRIDRFGPDRHQILPRTGSQLVGIALAPLPANLTAHAKVTADVRTMLVMFADAALRIEPKTGPIELILRYLVGLDVPDQLVFERCRHRTPVHFGIPVALSPITIDADIRRIAHVQAA